MAAADTKESDSFFTRMFLIFGVPVFRVIFITLFSYHKCQLKLHDEDDDLKGLVNPALNGVLQGEWVRIDVIRGGLSL